MKWNIFIKHLTENRWRSPDPLLSGYKSELFHIFKSRFETDDYDGNDTNSPTMALTQNP